MKSFLPETYTANYRRFAANTSETSQGHRKQAEHYYEQLESILTILENQNLSENDKLNALAQREKEMGVTLTELSNKVLREVAETGNVIISSSKNSSEALLISHLDYHSKDYNDDIDTGLFDLEQINQQLLADYKSDIPNQDTLDRILYPQNKYPTSKDLQKEKLRKEKSILKAQKLMANYQQKGKPFVLSQLSKKEFAVFQAGIEAKRDLTINLNNYLSEVLKNKDPAVEKQKLFLEELSATMNNRNINAAQRKGFLLKLPELKTGKHNLPLLRILTKKRKDALLAVESKIIETKSYNGYLGDLSVAYKKRSKKKNLCNHR